jgi:hypothetical protein
MVRARVFPSPPCARAARERDGRRKAAGARPRPGESRHDEAARAARAELLDNADELVTGRERRLRPAEIRAGAQLGIGERHAGGQNPDADFARTRSGIVVLHYPQDLGSAEVIDDNTLHRLSLAQLVLMIILSRLATGQRASALGAWSGAAF